MASLGWALLPIETAAGINPLNWPPAFFSWFAAGMLLAELTVGSGRVGRTGWRADGC